MKINFIFISLILCLYQCFSFNVKNDNSTQAKTQKDSILSLADIEENYFPLPKILDNNLTTFYLKYFNCGEIRIDTLTIINTKILKQKNVQIEQYNLLNFEVEYVINYNGVEFDNSALHINNQVFLLKNYTNYFSNSLTDSHFSFKTATWYNIHTNQSEYLIVDVGWEDCVGSLCRYSFYLIFSVENNKVQNLIIIDYFKSIVSNRPLWGSFKNELCYFNVARVTDNEVEIKPYVIAKYRIEPIKKGGIPIFVRFQISKNYEVIESDKFWYE